MVPQSRLVQRRRVNQACNTCRKSRIRCDGVRPFCGTCQRRREECTYNNGLPRRRVRSQMKSSHGAFPTVSDSLPAAPETSNILNPVTLGDEDDVGVTAMGLVSKSPKGDYATAKEHFGESSAIAFIQQLQDTLRLDSTVSSFDSERTHSRHLSQRERESRPLCGTEIGSLPPRPLADHLVSCYFSRIHTLYPFVHEPAFMNAYKSLWSSAESAPTRIKAHGLGLGSPDVSSTTFYFALNVVFALGCQFSDVVQVDREVTSEAFFQLCKPALDLNYLENGDLALCQTLLLMAHYLQSSSTPNRCWHVIGMACREAQALGLHSGANDPRFSTTEIQIRRRVWHGCVMLDLSASTMLGRPAMISQKPLTPKPDAIDDCYLTVDDVACEQPPGAFSRASWFVETLKLHDILRTILFKLYNNGGLVTDETTDPPSNSRNCPGIQIIAQIDAELQGFKENLPNFLDWNFNTHQDGGEEFMRERLLLKARFSYLKILLYRPVLSQMLRASKRNDQESRGIYAKYSLDCSVYCTEAAIDLASIVHQTCTNDLASVWFYNLFYIFTAASIILLAQLSPSIISVVSQESLEESWEKCYSCFDHLRLYHFAADRCARSLLMIRSKCLAAISVNIGEQSDATGRPLSSHQNGVENPSALPEIGAEMPFSEEFFGDMRFDDDTFLDPYWFDLQF